MSNNVQVKKLSNSSSDHVPVIASFKTNQKLPKHISKVTKRSQKLFSKERWNSCLASKDWSELDECEGVDEMVEIFTKNITEALDEVTPMKSFTIRSHHKFGLSEVAKEMMKQRDNCREKKG